MKLSRTLRALWISSRPVSWINTAFPFAAASLLLTREIDAFLIVGTLFFLIPYNVAMYGINDVFDYESDIRNPRKGGAHGAILTPDLHRSVLGASALMSAPFLVVLVLLRPDAASIIVLAVSVFAVIAYSAPPMRFKEVPFADSATSSVHFVSPAVYAIVAAGTEWTLPLIAVIAAFFLWGIASHAFGAVQDILADRAAGLSSIATVCGAAWTTRFAAAAYIAAGVLLLFAGTPAAWASPVALLYLAMVIPYLNLADEDAERATAGWRKFLWLNQIAGFIVTIVMIFTWMSPAER